ncbi:MAG: cytochrome D ubiquinol oxidase subunit II, partial [Sulfurimonas sp.]
DDIPVVLIGKKYWNKAIDFEFLKDEGVIDPQDTEIFYFADNADEAWEYILAWHKDKGAPLYDA